MSASADVDRPESVSGELTRRAPSARALLRLGYAIAIVLVFAAGLWAWLNHAARAESLIWSWGEEQTIEMLAPRWLALALLVPGLWLVPLFSLVDLPWPQRLLNTLLRSALVICLTLAVTDIVINDYDAKVATVVVVDVSESVPDALLDQARDYVQRLWDERGENQVRLVTFARDPLELSIPPASGVVPELARHEGEGAGLESNMGAALRLAFGLYPRDHLKRAVLITDGNLNRGDLLSEAVDAARYGIHLHSQEFEYEREPEVLIRAVDFPDNIRVNEPFNITVDVFSSFAGEIQLSMTQNEFRDIRGRSYEVQAGVVTQLEVRAEVYEPGRRTFTIEIDAESDRFDDNNEIVHVVEVEGRPQVLYVEGESRRSTYLERALDSERNSRVRFDMETRSARGFPDTLEEMEAFDLIILSDVEARYVSRTAMGNLERYVRGGGGFLMVGGEDSFGPGGYRGTAMEDLLPVTFESRRSASMPSVALMILIDRSGSMDGVRLEMAKQAARAAVELLGPQDSVGVIAFDTRPRTIVRLQSASNRVRINSDIGRITPGGGTEIYPALEEAWIELLDRRARTKHVILLTDGEAPYTGIAELASIMRSDRISVSTVGVGGDADRTLLEMIADITGGRDHYASSASSVPQIFVQETSQVTRSAMVEEPFRPRVVSDSSATRGIDFGSVPYLLGYVSTRAKSRATVSLETELGEPLYAYWRQGRGYAAVFTSDCKNRWMVEWIRDPVYQRFWAQTANQLMRRRSRQDDSLQLVADVERGRGRVLLDVIGDDDSFVNGLGGTVMVTDPEGESTPVELRQTAAGRYEGDFDLPAYGSYLLEGEHTRDGESFATSLASLANPYPDEYLAVGDEQTQVRQAVEVGGGAVNPSNATLFDPGEERIAFDREIWPYFLFLALGLLLLDILFRRVRIYGRMALDWGAVTR